jgi:hypothetical protein
MASLVYSHVSIRDIVQCRAMLTVVCNRTSHVPGEGDSFQTIGTPSRRYHDGLVHSW